MATGTRALTLKLLADVDNFTKNLDKADKDVMSAITASGGLLSTSDFNRQMQANPLWRQTQEAHDTASDFANTILKSFGFMG